jgi:hypothetical protein
MLLLKSVTLQHISEVVPAWLSSHASPVSMVHAAACAGLQGMLTHVPVPHVMQVFACACMQALETMDNTQLLLLLLLLMGNGCLQGSVDVLVSLRCVRVGGCDEAHPQ